jgi:hypothetical protein
MPVLDKIAEKLHLTSPGPQGGSGNPETGAKKEPALDSSKITVIFVLGGPGAGTNLQLTQSQVYS